MSNNYWEDLIKKEFRKVENLQDGTRQGKAGMIFVNVFAAELEKQMSRISV